MNEDKTLHILWTNADINTSLHMVMMYATNSMLRHWWDEVTVIIWGGTAPLVAENELVQEKMKLAMQAGVKFSACIACASIFGVVDKLKRHGHRGHRLGAEAFGDLSVRRESALRVIT